MDWLKTLVTALFALLAMSCTQSPTGRNQFMMYSDSDMSRLGDSSFADLKQQEKVSTDRALNQYVRCIADDLIAVLPAPYKNKSWDVVVFDNPAVNAFALPGENIGVYTGLLKVTENPAQLAAVIGHEIAHVIAQHGNERMSTQMAAGIGMQLGGAVLAAEYDEKTAGTVMAVLGVGVQLGVLLPYSRTHESEADQLGVDYLAAAGYDPREAANLWRNMSAQGGAQVPEFLSTHPSPSTRIQTLANYAQTVMPSYQRALQQNGAPNCRKPG